MISTAVALKMEVINHRGGACGNRGPGWVATGFVELSGGQL
jgi:hypothetical protein